MKIALLLLLFIIPSALAIHLEHQPDLIMNTSQTYNLKFRIYSEDGPAQQVIKYFYTDRSIVVDGRIGGYHDFSSMTNYSWKEYSIQVTPYSAGTFTFYWGINLTARPAPYYITNSSGDAVMHYTMNESEQFIITAVGNTTDINSSMGVNESDYGKKPEPRYGSGSLDIVKQRLAATALAQSLKLNQTKSLNRTTNKIVNVTPPLLPVVKPIVKPPVKPVEKSINLSESINKTNVKIYEAKILAAQQSKRFWSALLVITTFLLMVTLIFTIKYVRKTNGN